MAKVLRIIFAAFLTLLCSHNQSMGQEYAKAALDYHLGNHEKSVGKLLKYAEEGDVFAQFIISYTYKNGYHLKEDIGKSRYWYEKSAKSGHLWAQTGLADLLVGAGEGADDRRSYMALYEAAAKRGNEHAYHALEAFKILGARKVDNIESLFNVMKDVSKDNIDATYWVCRQSDYKLEEAPLRGVIDWCRDAANKGHPGAQYRLSLLLLQDGYLIHEKRLFFGNVDEVEKNIPEGVKWLKEAAKNGHVDAMTLLSKYYAIGRHVPVDYEQAARLARKAHEKGDNQAASILGVLTAVGKGVEQNAASARTLLEQSSMNGSLLSSCVLGYFYLHGEVFEMDLKKGAEILVALEHFTQQSKLSYLKKIYGSLLFEDCVGTVSDASNVASVETVLSSIDRAGAMKKAEIMRRGF